MQLESKNGFKSMGANYFISSKRLKEHFNLLEDWISASQLKEYDNCDLLANFIWGWQQRQT